MEKGIIKVNKISFISLMLCFIMLFFIISPTINAVTIEEPNIEAKVKELEEDIKQYENENAIIGDVIDFSKFDFSKTNTITSKDNSYKIVKEGNNYTITLNNLICKKIILPADDADLEDLKEGDIKYTGKSRKTYITFIIKGDNKVTGYGIEGYPVKGIKIEGDGNLLVNAFSEPKVEKVSKKSGNDWLKKAELTYYTKAGISVETGNEKYSDRSSEYNDINSLVFAGTGNITIYSPKYYGIINNGDIKFKSGNINVESKRSAISGYGIYIEPDTNNEIFNIEFMSQEKAFYDKPTFLGNNYIVMASKSSIANNAEIKTKEDVSNLYYNYKYVNVKFANEKNAPVISESTVKQGGVYCSLPVVTVTDDTAIDSITVNGVKINTGFSVNTAKKKVFKVPSSNNEQKEIIATDILGNKTKISFIAYSDHQLQKPVKTEEVKPTCSEDGYHLIAYTCSICKSIVFTQKVTDKALGHKFGNWETTANSKKRECTVCGYTEEEQVTKSITSAKISLSNSTYTYDGNKKEPTVVILDGNNKLIQGRDYILTYSNNIMAGTASVKITGINNYKNTVYKNFTIEKANNSITAYNVTKKYSSKAQSFELGAKQTGNTKLTYSSNNKNITVNSSGKVTIAKGFVGKATITITANSTPQYNKATKQITVTVNKANNSIAAPNITRSYSSSAKSFNLEAKQTGDAKLTYSSNNKNVKINSSGKVTIAKGFIGKATITITANSTSKYNKATKKITIKVNPPAVKLSKISNPSSKKMTITWNKSTAVTGYQLQYSTDKNFNKNVTTVSVTNKNTTTRTFSNLKKKSKYYVRVRTYKIVSGITYYSAWSSSKNITIKK